MSFSHVLRDMDDSIVLVTFFQTSLHHSDLNFHLEKQIYDDLVTMSETFEISLASENNENEEEIVGDNEESEEEEVEEIPIVLERRGRKTRGNRYASVISGILNMT